MGGTEALERGFPAELPPLFGTAAGSVAEEIGRPGDPDALEGVDGLASGIAEFSVVEGDGVISDRNALAACSGTEGSAA